MILCRHNVDTLNICTKEFIIFVCTDSTEIFLSKLRSSCLNYNLPSFFTDSYCAGVSNKYCLLTFFIHFNSNFDSTFCEQTVQTLTRCCILRLLIWICTVCPCLTKRKLGLYGLNVGEQVSRGIFLCLFFLTHLASSPYLVCEQGRLWQECTFTQAGLSLYYKSLYV